ncbi:hypothetical protein AQPE_1490 [Aquipluma nitroreducens]|uniref:Uncharacterized protein n=1 Tax=Aquipluma nitroreducens TaxID=2010828 RepID=A0A5K7S6Z0_9BACT|nr:hypothetical protein AQPE_1490 [Aquipluma nitroreducens]
MSRKSVLRNKIYGTFILNIGYLREFGSNNPDFLFSTQ